MPCGEPHHQEVLKIKDVPASEPVPEGLDFDFWLGHTQKAEYSSRRCHFWWRFILAHGGGEMTDRGAHVIDLAQMGLDTEKVEEARRDTRNVGVDGPLAAENPARDHPERGHLLQAGHLFP